MRTNNRTFIALNADFFIPNRNFKSNVSFLPPGRRKWISSVNWHFAYGNQVAFASDYPCGYVLNKFRNIAIPCNSRLKFLAAGNFIRSFNFEQIFKCLINCCIIHLYYLISLCTVSFLNRFFNHRDCAVFRENIGDCKETGLHDCINSHSHSCFVGNFICINDIKLHFSLYKIFLYFFRQRIPNLIFRDFSI